MSRISADICISADTGNENTEIEQLNDKKQQILFACSVFLMLVEVENELDAKNSNTSFMPLSCLFYLLCG